MGRQYSGLDRKKNICPKKLEDMRVNLIRKLQTSRYRTPRITKNA